ncbi:NAD(P)H:quinone oxidoreductase [Halobacillus yeomjeoni]|uniref:NAD(P)H:quinone oxidoreductase n=1 Tax=Halobacillus yeomjeoni TaxID=311194 RepID=A0A931HRC9_9BACI|nr:NAD(P)H:quinone oxidoreductase [Halobacillus yeomjeoni]MBH0228680.1 NAD(P)H:quinone oxidoreductase [Halobacillus yeomjeoni]MCA0983917.1 NAD(P)H:quinone oxidoreductase [Halobacillus yeomjeoni]
MSNVKLAIVYYSSTGTNYKMAQWAEDAAREAGAEVKLARVPETAPMEAMEQNPAWKEHYLATKDTVPEAKVDDLDWADAIIFSAPTRFGNVPAQLKQYLDQSGGLWFQGKLINKVVSAMTSAQNPHGGQEATLLNLYTTMFHWGAIIAAPGYTNDAIFGAGGNPYGTSVSVDGEANIKDDEEAAKAAVYHQVNRTLEVASKFTGE